MEEEGCCFTKNQLNFFRVCHLVTNVLPCELGNIFVQQWNLLYASTHGTWCNTPQNGQAFLSMESGSNKKRNGELIRTMKNGNTKEWDCTMLFYALLYSSSVGENLDSEMRGHLNSFRKFRNDCFAHVSKGELTSSEFQIILNKLVQALVGLRRDASSVKKVQNLNSFTSEEIYQLETKLAAEKAAQFEMDKRICSLENRVLHLESKNCEVFIEDYSNFRELSLDEDNSTHFVILPQAPNHPVIKHHQVDEIVKSLSDLKVLQNEKITSIFILGDPLSGKTVCANTVGQILSKQNSIVVALKCDSFQTFASSLKCLAERFDYPGASFPGLEKASIEAQIEIISLFVKEKLSILSSWVVIFDGVLQETKELLKYLPQPGQEGEHSNLEAVAKCRK